jgi:hypothetical protein
MKNEQKETEKEFVQSVLSAFNATQSEASERNERISRNDGFIYGEEIKKALDIPAGHDITPINWLRRTVEIHRAQFMGKGFSFDSSYDVLDVKVDDEQEKSRRVMENDKKKSYAEIRRALCETINEDNGSDAFWSSAAENASAVGDTVIKAWYDKEEKKYIIQQIESIENFYVIWSRDDYRKKDAVAFAYQITPSEAIRLYGVPKEVATSPLGSPFVLKSGTNSQSQSSQQMVSIVEVTGKFAGFRVDKDNNIQECRKGDENEFNTIIVGNEVYQVISDWKSMPEYYILPNKLARKRAWGLPDITNTAIEINMTFIEALSDWRTVSSKVNFPKYKAFGFPVGVQPPKPKSRTVEFIPLAEGQDIQPIAMNQSASLAEVDFRNQLEEMQNQYVREVGISRQLFDMPDAVGNSNPAMLTAMKSVSDITNAKRELWTPIIRSIFEDAIRKIAEHDSNIKEVISDEDWRIKISFPSAMNSDDPSYTSGQLNMFNTGVISLQTLLENLGYDKQEVDRIRSEMEDPLTAAIHGHLLNELAAQKINPPSDKPAEPKVSINLRGNMSPEQEANLASNNPQIANGPFPLTTSPQGNAGLTATDNLMNQGDITGKQNAGGMPINNPVPKKGETAQPQEQPIVQGPTANQSGVGIMSQPGSGATPVTAQGSVAQQAQRLGA